MRFINQHVVDKALHPVRDDHAACGIEIKLQAGAIRILEVKAIRVVFSKVESASHILDALLDFKIVIQAQKYLTLCPEFHEFRIAQDDW